MKLTFKSPLWWWGILVLALLFISWSVSLILSVTRLQDEASRNVALINKFNSVEQTIRTLEDSMASNGEHLALSSDSWQQVITSYRTNLQQLTADERSQLGPAAPILHLDSLVAQLNNLYIQIEQEKLAKIKDQTLTRRFQYQIHLAINDFRTVLQSLRTHQAKVSIALVSKWQELTRLVVISCLLAFFLSIVLLIYQRDLSRRLRAEKGLQESEERFRRLAENAPDLIYRYRFTPTPAFEYVSPAVNAMSGCTPEEFYADPGLAFKLVYPDDLVHLEMLKNSPPTSVMDLTLRWQHRDGSLIWTEQRLMPIVDAAGKVFAIEGIVRNVTRRKLAEQALRESEVRFHSMADTAPVLLWMAGPDQRCSFFNKSWLEFTGRPIEEELGEGWTRGIHPDDRTKAVEAYNTAFTARREFKIEYRFKRHDGEYRWLVNTGLPRWLADGSFAGYLGSCLDFTEHRQVEDSLRASEEALRHSEERYRTLIEQMPDGLYRSTPDGKYVDVNSALVKILGYDSRENLLQVDIKSQIYFDNREREEAMAAAKQPSNDGVVILRHRRKDGQEVWLEDHGRFITDANGTVIYQEGILRDVTARKLAEDALRQSEERYRTLIERLSDGVYRSTPDGKFIEVNPAMVRMLGYANKDELLAVDIRKQLYFEEGERNTVVDKLQRAGGDEIDIFRLRRKDGREVWVEDHGRLVTDATGKVIYHEGILRDISARRRTEEALRESEERYRSVIGALAEGVVLHDAEGRIIASNASAERILGFAASQLQGRQTADFNWSAVHEDNTPFPAEMHPAMVSLRTGQSCSNVVMGIHKPGGELAWISINSQPLLRAVESTPYAVVVSFYEITERRWAEEALRESEERYRLLAENSLDLIELIDLDGNVMYASPSHFYVLGHTPNELVYQNLFSFVHHDDVPKALLAVNELMDSKTRKTIELRLHQKNGTWIEVEALLSGIPGPGNNIHRILFSARDIAARKLAEAHLKSSLKEKEVLLKEIHHRVKNNLQIISSLLNLQSGYIQDPQAGELFKESRNRVKSMALIHERLYQSKDLARIDFAEYVRNLTTHLFRSYGVTARAVSLQIAVDNILLDIDTAIPCGLIINELVTNSLKYAFPPGLEGEIRIGLHRESNGQLALNVSDNGTGLSPDFDFQKTESLGLQLVNTLTDQLQGQIEIERQGGTTFKILLHPHHEFEVQENF